MPSYLAVINIWLLYYLQKSYIHDCQVTRHALTNNFLPKNELFKIRPIYECVQYLNFDFVLKFTDKNIFLSEHFNSNIYYQKDSTFFFLWIHCNDQH